MEEQFLKFLINNKLVYYIYRTDFNIYDIPDSIKYYVIIDKEFKLPKKYQKFIHVTYDWENVPYFILINNTEFCFDYKESWFNDIVNNNIMAYEFYFQDKKFISKEYVKIPVPLNLLNIRTFFDSKYNTNTLFARELISMNNNIEKAKRLLFILIKDAILYNQIIEFNKIVNYKVIKEVYTIIDNSNENLIDVFDDLSNKYIKPLLQKTENILRKSKIKNLLNGSL